jgi:hypothetical protein
MGRIQSAAVTAIVIAGVFSLALAQNARIDALGGANIVPDFSRTLYNPAIMHDYKDHAEITFNSGAIMGTKSVGSAFSLGAYMNRGLMLRNFYSGAGAALNFTPYTVSTGANIPNLANMQYFPHILWGFDLETIQIGFDTYFEWDRRTYTSLVEVPGNFQEIDESLTIYHPGIIAGFKINMASAQFLLHVGGGMPRASGTIERKNVTPIGTARIETEIGIFGRAGAELMMQIQNTALTVGLDGRYESFQFSQRAPVSNANKVRTDIVTDITGTPYLGTTTRFGNGLLMVLMGRSIVDILQNENDTGTSTQTEIDIRHTLIGGVEKQFQKPWKFDSLALRGGVSWFASNAWESTEVTTVPVTQTTTTPITTLGPAYPYLGCGVSKKFFRMDLLLNPASWNAALVGPAVSRVTISLNY